MDEQEKIFQNLRVHFTSWSSMSKILPGRTENSIKNYFYSSIRRLKSNPVYDIISDIYIAKKIEFHELPAKKFEIQQEVSKFNRLSQLICEYILNPLNQKENFLQFLLGVLLEHKCPKQEKVEIKTKSKDA